MSSILSHAIVPLAISPLFPADALPPFIVLAGTVCANAPDVDVVGFLSGVRYGDLLGHRGLTHSVFFAVALSAVLTYLLWPMHLGVAFLFLFLSTLSHPLLDAMTDGGLGIAFFSPFSNRRYFFPVRPIAVPPIGIRAFFSKRGWQGMKSEACWIWLPSIGLYALAKMLTT